MFTTDELKRSKMCCVLSETELTRFAEKAADVRLAPGEWLIREGEPPWFYVLFEGKLRIVKDVLGHQQDLFEYEYAVGDSPILLGTLALVSLRAETHCRVARNFQNLIRKLGDPAERGCSPKKIPLAKPKSHIDNHDERRHPYKGTNHSHKRLT
jgi:thioredoxin reductase (NADPH)